MTNPFSPESLVPKLSNYPVTKGDVKGHAFHGNQYAERSRGDTIAAKNKIEDTAARMYRDAGKVSAMRHDQQARRHIEEAGRMRQLASKYKNPNNRSYQHEQSIAKLHEAAAAAHYAAADNPSAENTLKAVNASYAATSGNNGGVTDGENIYATQGNADGGPITTDEFVKSAEIRKGDVQGHAFHGNQYAAASNVADGARAAANRGKYIAATTNFSVNPFEAGLQVSAHSQAALDHSKIAAQALRQVSMTSDPDEKARLMDEAEKHFEAASAHSNALGSWSKVARGYQDAKVAAEKSFDALQASQNAEDSSKP